MCKTMALVMRNWGSMNEMKHDPITLPSSFRIGIGYDLESSLSILKDFTITADYEIVKGAKNFGMTGIEWRLIPQMSLQGGYQLTYTTRSVCGGARFYWKRFWIDYGYAPFGESLGNTHRISLGLNW